MLRSAAAVLILIAGLSTARAQSAAERQKELKMQAAILSVMTDMAFLATASRKTEDQAAPGGDAAADLSADPRLSRPRALSMVYETLAALEYQQAAGPAGEGSEAAVAKVQTLSRKSSLLVDPTTQKASRGYARLSARVKSGQASLTAAGRSTGHANKKMAALQKTLDETNAQLADPAASPAAKASLHAKAGKIYEEMAGAAALQASVAVVTASVIDDAAPAADGAAAEASGDHPSARKSSGPRAASSAKLQALAAKVRSAKKGVIVKSRGPAARVRGVSRATALRSLYRQLAAADYRDCAAAPLPASARVQAAAGLKRLSVAGEPSAADAAAPPDAAPAACGCPSGAAELGDDANGLCYCSDEGGAAASDAPADVDMDRRLARLDGEITEASRQIASRETPKSNSRISSAAQGRYRRAQAYERMAAAATRAPFPASSRPTAARLGKLAARLRSGSGPVTIVSAGPKGSVRSTRVPRSLALKKTYQLMAALDFRAAVKAGLPAAKARSASASLRGLHASLAEGAPDSAEVPESELAVSTSASDPGADEAAFIGADSDAEADFVMTAATSPADAYAGTPLDDSGELDPAADGAPLWTDVYAADGPDAAAGPDDAVLTESETSDAPAELTDAAPEGCAEGDDACAADKADAAQAASAFDEDLDPAAWDRMQTWWTNAPSEDAGAAADAAAPEKACPPASRVIQGSKKGFAVCAAESPAAKAAGARKSGRPVFSRLARLERAANGVSRSLSARAASRQEKAGLLYQRAQVYASMASAIKSGRAASAPKASAKAAAKAAQRPAAAKARAPVAGDEAATPPDAVPAPPDAAPADAVSAPDASPEPAPEDANRKLQTDLEKQGEDMGKQIRERTGQ